MRVDAFLGKTVLGIIAILLLWVTAGAAGFPDRPIQVLVGWSVGSSNDSMDRAIAKPLSKILKQPVIVQNVPGGGGALVLGRVKSEKPDGYALFQTGLNAYSQIPLTRAVPFDPFKDFAFLAQHARFEHYLACRSDSPWKSFEELIQYVKNNPKKVSYATSGVGGPSHILMEYLAMKENLQWIHVPYNSATEVATALLGKHVDLLANSVGVEFEYINTGRFRPLLCLNDKRMEPLPDLPTILEKGYDFVNNASCTWSVPANTPKDVQKTLEKALLQAFADPEARDIMKKWNKPYDPLDSEETTKAVIKDHQKYGELMKKLGLGIYKK
jgi:tripartite-type tricarboxylate transporter receptor subunit TctC